MWSPRQFFENFDPIEAGLTLTPIGDLNGDNLLDNGDRAIDMNDLSFWVKEYKQSWIGDANLDGEFNTGDLVDVFQAGKLETDEDASWVEGDWTVDRRFNSADLVAAFQDGGFETGRPIAANYTVPEPIGILPVVVSAFALGILRRRRSIAQI